MGAPLGVGVVTAGVVVVDDDGVAAFFALPHPAMIAAAANTPATASQRPVIQNDGTAPKALRVLRPSPGGYTALRLGA